MSVFRAVSFLLHKCIKSVSSKNNDERDQRPKTAFCPVRSQKDREARYIGSTRDGVRDICTETFDIFGTSLIQSARPGGLLIMDEIGHMEKDASRFLRAVFEALDDDIPILASVRYTTTPIDYLERIKHHPRVRLYTLTEENRDDAYAEIRDHILGAGRKEEIDHETL